MSNGEKGFQALQHVVQTSYFGGGGGKHAIGKHSVEIHVQCYM